MQTKKKLLKKRAKNRVVLFYENGAANGCCPENGGTPRCCPGASV